MDKGLRGACYADVSALISKRIGVIYYHLRNYRLDYILTFRKYTNKKLSCRRDSARRRSLCRSRSFKVTDFVKHRKPSCHVCGRPDFSRSFRVCGRTIWNKLPQDLRSTDTREQFKRSLNRWLFECAYCK